MSDLQVAVYVAPPIPLPGSQGDSWSPISCTLIYSSHDAILVDTPLTIKQSEELIEWIEKIAPNRKLSYIYITHGHGDHFFGVPVILKRFPNAVPVATRKVLEHMKQQVEKNIFKNMWELRFPGQIYQPQLSPLASILPESGKFRLENRWVFEAIECGHSDTYDSTVLWVPDLKLAVCGDVVYGKVHQYLFEANNEEKRKAWIQAIEKVEALGPLYVVPGHKQSGELDGIWHLSATKKYILDFEDIIKSNPKDSREVFRKMMELYGDRFNPSALKLSCKGAIVAKESHI
ncbi:beta-lactamase-like protein [Talaromyces proteolyticus]|uniref:Beta-lactamase-like protein n=1 Tax=Talaromyces proteolyticus TaxID=1131652 RepID=A0AAD4KKH8_9EURO|nr:beta-lactamase-like protein [Talaromyces proteolyticus]KAH8692303.1 beta-lactamase-like protein [Talaromyces proteolyticus]